MVILIDIRNLSEVVSSMNIFLQNLNSSVKYSSPQRRMQKFLEIRMKNNYSLITKNLIGLEEVF